MPFSAIQTLLNGWSGWGVICRRLQILWAEGDLARKKKPAKKLFERNLYRYIASDAHKPEHYKYLTRALINSHAAEHILRYK